MATRKKNPYIPNENLGDGQSIFSPGEDGMPPERDENGNWFVIRTSKTTGMPYRSSIPDPNYGTQAPTHPMQAPSGITPPNPYDEILKALPQGYTMSALGGGRVNVNYKGVTLPTILQPVSQGPGGRTWQFGQGSSRYSANAWLTAQQRGEAWDYMYQTSAQRASLFIQEAVHEFSAQRSDSPQDALSKVLAQGDFNLGLAAANPVPWDVNRNAELLASQNIGFSVQTESFEPAGLSGRREAAKDFATRLAHDVGSVSGVPMSQFAKRGYAPNELLEAFEAGVFRQVTSTPLAARGQEAVSTDRYGYTPWDPAKNRLTLERGGVIANRYIWQDGRLVQQQPGDFNDPSQSYVRTNAYMAGDPYARAGIRQNMVIAPTLTAGGYYSYETRDRRGNVEVDNALTGFEKTKQVNLEVKNLYDLINTDNPAFSFRNLQGMVIPAGSNGADIGTYTPPGTDKPFALHLPGGASNAYPQSVSITLPESFDPVSGLSLYGRANARPTTAIGEALQAQVPGLNVKYGPVSQPVLEANYIQEGDEKERMGLKAAENLVPMGFQVGLPGGRQVQVSQVTDEIKTPSFFTYNVWGGRTNEQQRGIIADWAKEKGTPAAQGVLDYFDKRLMGQSGSKDVWSYMATRYRLNAGSEFSGGGQEFGNEVFQTVFGNRESEPSGSLAYSQRQSRNQEKYGMSYQKLSYPLVMTPENFKLEQRNIERALRQDPTLAHADNQTIQTEIAKVFRSQGMQGKNIMAQVEPAAPALVAENVVTPRQLEFANKATANYAMQLALSYKVPEFAKFLGLGVGDTKEDFASSRSQLDIVSWRSYQKGLNQGGTELPTNAISLSDQKATELRSYLYTSENMGSPEWYAGLGQVTGGNPDDPLYFPKLKMLFPGRGTAEEEQYTEYGEQIGKSTREWTKGLAGLIQANYFADQQTPEVAHVQGMEAVYDYLRYQENVQGAKGNAAKGLLSKEITSGLGGRYVESSLLNPGEAWLSPHMVRTLMRKQGLHGEDIQTGAKQFEELAQQGLIGSIGVRFPQLALGHSLVGEKILSNEEMLSRMPGATEEERMQHMRRYEQTYRNKLAVAPGFNQQTVGDNDLDNMVRVLGIKIDDRGKLVPANSAELSGITRKTADEVEAEELRGFGSLDRANAANADVKAVKDLSSSGWDPFKIFRKGGRRPVEEFENAALNVAASKMTGMGTAHNIGIDFIAGLGARGVKPEVIDRLANVTQPAYQEMIDMNVKGWEAGGINMPTMVAFAQAGQLKSRETGEPITEPFLSFGINKPQEQDPRYTQSLRMPISQIGTGGETEYVMNMAQLATQPVNINGEKTQIYGPEQLAAAFSYDESQTDTLKGQLEAAGPQGYSKVLKSFITKGEGQPGYYENLRHMPVYFSTLISTWRKTHKATTNPEEEAGISEKRDMFDRALDLMGGNIRKEVASAGMLASLARKEGGIDILTPAALREGTMGIPAGTPARAAAERWMNDLNVPLESPELAAIGAKQQAAVDNFANLPEVEYNSHEVHQLSEAEMNNPAYDPKNFDPNAPLGPKVGSGRGGGGSQPPIKTPTGGDDSSQFTGRSSGPGGGGPPGGGNPPGGNPPNNRPPGGNNGQFPWRPKSDEEIKQLFRDAASAYSGAERFITPELIRVQNAAIEAGLNIEDAQGNRANPLDVKRSLDINGAPLAPSRGLGIVRQARNKVATAMGYQGRMREIAGREDPRSTDTEATDLYREVSDLSNPRSSAPGAKEFNEAALYGRYTDSTKGSSGTGGKVMAQLDPEQQERWNKAVKDYTEVISKAETTTIKQKEAYEKLNVAQQGILREAGLAATNKQLAQIEAGVSTGGDFDIAKRAKLIKQRESLMSEDDQANEQAQSNNWGKLGRNLFGGWGLMYMRSVGNIMMQGAGGEGYAEREGLQVAQQQAAIQAGGTLSAGTNMANYYQNRMALTGANYNPQQAMAMLGANNPLARTAGNVVLAGLGGFAASEWASQMLSNANMGTLPKMGPDGMIPGTGFAGGLAGAAPYLAGAVAGGSLILGAYAGSFDTQSLAMQTAKAQMGPGRGSYNLAAALSNPQAAMSTGWNMFFAPDRMTAEQKQEDRYAKTFQALNGLAPSTTTQFTPYTVGSKEWNTNSILSIGGPGGGLGTWAVGGTYKDVTTPGYQGQGIANIYQQIPGITRGEVASVLSEDILTKFPFVSQQGAISAGTFYAYNNKLAGGGAGALTGQTPTSADQMRATVATQLGAGVNLTQLFAQGLAATGTPITSSLAPSGQAAQMMEQFYQSQMGGIYPTTPGTPGARVAGEYGRTISGAAQGMAPEMQQMLQTGFGIMGQTQGAAWAKFTQPSVLGANGQFLNGSLGAEGMAVATLSASPERLALYQQQNTVNNQAATMFGWNAPYVSAGQVAGQTAGMNRQDLALQSSANQTLMNWQSNVYNGNPLQWGQIATQPGVNLGSMPALQTTYGTSIGAEYAGFTGYNMAGQQTGGEWGRQSLQMGRVSGAEMASRIWGPGAGGDLLGSRNMAGFYNKAYGSYGGGYINAQINGVKLANGELAGGSIGGQQWAQDQSYGLSMASIGVQMKGIALNEAFTTGVGINKYAGTVNPQTGQPFGFNTGNFSFSSPGGSFTSQGGGTWGLEDAQRNLGYAQTMFGFQQQQKGMNLQSTQFAENMGLQKQGMTLSRTQGTYEFGFSTQMAEQQFGFGQTMYREQARFTSGRERRLGEMQNEENVTVYNMETEHRKKEFDFQKQQWALQDEQFKTQIKQFNQTKELQQEQLNASIKFFEINKELQEEAVKLSRAQWVEQIKLQKESAGIQAASITLQHQLNEADLVEQKFMEDTKNKLNNLNANTFPNLIKNLETAVPNAFITMVNKMRAAVGLPVDNSGYTAPTGSGGGGGNGGSTNKPTAQGGMIGPGESARVGDSLFGFTGVEESVFALPSGGAMITPDYASKRAAAALMSTNHGPAPENNTIIRASKSSKTTPNITKIYIGNREIQSFIVETVEGQING